MSITIIITLLALVCSFIIATSNIFNLRDRFTAILAKKTASREYLSLLEVHLQKISFPLLVTGGQRKAVPIESIYVDLPLSRRVDANEEEGLQAKSPSTNIGYATYLLTTSETKELETKPFNWNSLGSKERIILVGDRGAGKTTNLRWIAYTAAKQLLNSQRKSTLVTADEPLSTWVPIFVACKDVAAGLNPTTSFVQAVLRAQLDNLQLTESKKNYLKQYLVEMLDEGRLLVLLDALDEIPSSIERQRFCQALVQFSKTYPKTTICVSVLSTLYQSLSNQFDQSFQMVQIEALQRKDKANFAKKWTELFVNEQNQLIAKEALQNLIHSSPNIIQLTDNIQLLTIITQLQQKNGALPESKYQIVQALVALLLERDQAPDKLTFNEIMPQLEFLAHEMWTKQHSRLSRQQINEILEPFRQRYLKELTSARSVNAFLNKVMEQTGLLQCIAKEIDNRGRKQEYFAFSHQTFQSFFATKAKVHGHVEYVFNPTGSTLDRAINFLDGLAFVKLNQEITSVETNYAFDATHLEIAETFLAELHAVDKEEFLERLRSPSTPLSPGEGNSRAIFTALLLAKEEDLPIELSRKILEDLVEATTNNKVHLTDTPNSSFLGQAIQSLTKSTWSLAFREALLSAYYNLSGEARFLMARTIIRYFIELPELVKNKDWAFFTPFFETFTDKSSSERLFITFKLIEGIRINQGITDTVHQEHIRIVTDVIMGLNDDSEAWQTAKCWLLHRISRAGNYREKNFAPIGKSHESFLMEVLQQPQMDSHAIYWACLALSRLENLSILSPIDWIYEWAVLADRGQRWTQLPQVEPYQGIVKYVTMCKQILQKDSGYHPVAKEGAALALGRMNHFFFEAKTPLVSILRDGDAGYWARQEAIAYLTNIKDSIIPSLVYQLYCDSNSDETTKNYAFLASLALADIPTLISIYQRDSDIEGESVDRKAIEYTLYTHSAVEAKTALRKLKGTDDLSRLDEYLAPQNKLNQDVTVDAKTIQKVITDATAEDEDENPTEKTVCILIVRGENPDGGSIYAYVAVRADRLGEFMEAQKSDMFYPEDYGVILESGEGEPSEEVKKMMEEDYGFDHQIQVNLE